MNARFMLDTNLLVYLVSQTETRKREIVERVLAEKHCLTGINNLNEAANVLTKKFHLSAAQIEQFFTKLLATVALLPFDTQTILAAIRVKERYGFSYFDSLASKWFLVNVV